MSVRAVWCLWLAALTPLCAAWDVTWPACSTTNHRRIVSRRTSDLEAIWLHLEKCNIKSLDPGSFSNLPNLRRIYLNSNNIKQLDVLLFVPVPFIEIISLDKNMLQGKELPPQLFRNNRKIKEINFSYNDMSDAPFDLLKGLGELEILTLVSCSLRHVPLLVTQPALNSLTHLYLNHNRIQQIEDPDTFSRLKNLQYLILSNNSIEYLHEDILKPLANLTVVFLGYNRIKYIPDKLFHNHHFDIIDLTNNLIQYLPANGFLRSSFQEIDLDGNRLTYLPDTIYPAFVKWTDVRESLLFPNPWQCACLNEILVQFKKRGIRYDSTLLDGKHPVCELTDGPCIKNTRIAVPPPSRINENWIRLNRGTVETKL